MTRFYTDQRKVELRVGIIVVLTAVILLVGYAWLRNTLQMKSMTEIKIRFANAQGLENGDKVTVNGMEAGRVSSITQLEDGVLVICRLKLKYPITKGARYVIQDSNLMGGKQLEILNANNGEPIDISAIQAGENTYGLMALITTASEAMEQIDILLTELNKPEGVISQLSSTFSETKETLGKVSTAVEESKDNLSIALKQISNSAHQLNELLVQVRPNLDKSLLMTPELFNKAQTVLDSLQTASSVLQEAVIDMTSGKGTLQSLIKDDKLYKNLINSSARLDSLLIDIKKNPSRYFRLKVF